MFLLIFSVKFLLITTITYSRFYKDDEYFAEIIYRIFLKKIWKKYCCLIYQRFNAT